MVKVVFLVMVFGFVSANEFERVFEIHSKNLPYLEEPHDRFLVVFSGTPGMGKTTVAKEIEKRFHGVRICADEVRAIIRELGKSDEEPYFRISVEEYFPWLLRKLDKEYPNHLLILDRSIDRQYDTYLPFTQKFSYPVFLIRLNISREVARERIRQRGIEVEWFLERFDKFWEDYERFGQTHSVDYLFGEEAPLAELFQRIDGKMRNGEQFLERTSSAPICSFPSDRK